MIRSINIVYVLILLFSFNAHANSLLKVNKISAGEDKLLVHASLSVASELEVVGGMSISLWSEGFVDSDCYQELQRLNEGNPFLEEVVSFYKLNEEELDQLWLINTSSQTQNGVCSERTAFSVIENYIESQFTMLCSGQEKLATGL